MVNELLQLPDITSIYESLTEPSSLKNHEELKENFLACIIWLHFGVCYFSLARDTTSKHTLKIKAKKAQALL